MTIDLQAVRTRRGVEQAQRKVLAVLGCIESRARNNRIDLLLIQQQQVHTVELSLRAKEQIEQAHQ